MKKPRKPRLKCRFVGGPADGLRFTIVMDGGVVISMTGSSMTVVGPGPSEARTVYVARDGAEPGTVVYVPEVGPGQISTAGATQR